MARLLVMIGWSTHKTCFLKKQNPDPYKVVLVPGPRMEIWVSFKNITSIRVTRIPEGAKNR